MSGFGSTKEEFEYGSINIDIKSVNSRFLDFRLHAPGYISKYELDIKNIVNNAIKRGKVDMYFNSKLDIEGSNKVIINSELMSSYLSEVDSFCKKNKITNNISASDLLRIKDAFEYEKIELDEHFFEEKIKPIIEKTLDELTAMRDSEGESIYDFIVEKVRALNGLKEEVLSMKKEEISLYTENLRTKIYEIMGEVDYDKMRFEQEIAYMIDKKDVSEEISRIESHLSQIDTVINLDINQPKGKKLDFIIQELNREINTIASKSFSADIRKNVVEMKTIVEQIREQSANVE